MLNNLTKNILEPQDVQALTPDLSKVKIIPQETAQKVEAVVFDSNQNELHVLTTNNHPEELQNILTQLGTKGFSSKLFYTDPTSFAGTQEWYTKLTKIQQDQKQAAQAQKEAVGSNALTMIESLYQKRDTMKETDFMNEMIRLAFQAGASDLHFQPEEEKVIMRLRLDGILQTVLEFTHKEFFRYLQQLKLMAGTKMNVDYVPQDGRFSFQATKDGVDYQIDVRVNFMPGSGSESTVMRFLDGSKTIKKFEDLGFSDEHFQLLQKHMSSSFGMILVTGPTGSGKTTTLYSMLNHINNGSKKIITLEDPIEYMVSGIQQSQINYNKDYDYEKGLKACMRHDPDVILVGETRSKETAETAIDASLTGHLLFTTLHTNSAIEAISRVLTMGVAPYTFAPSLNVIIAQRLVRKLCPHCATKRPAKFNEQEEINKHIEKITDARKDIQLSFDDQVFEPTGCDKCNGTGYKGRIALIEILNVSEEIKQMIIDGKSTLDIYAAARQNGFITLQEDGIMKMLKGETTLDEVRRVSG